MQFEERSTQKIDGESYYKVGPTIINYWEMLTNASGDSLSTLNSKFFYEKLGNQCIENCNSWLFKGIIAKLGMLKECPEGTR